MLRGVVGCDGLTEGVRDGGRESSVVGTVSCEWLRTGKYSCVGGALFVVDSGGVGMRYMSELMRTGIRGASASGWSHSPCRSCSSLIVALNVPPTSSNTDRAGLGTGAGLSGGGMIMSEREFDLCLVAEAEVVDVLLIVFDRATCAIFWMSAPDSEGLLLSAGDIAGVSE